MARKIHMPTPNEDIEIQRGIEADGDARELTDEELARMRPAAEVLPEVAAAYKAGQLKGRGRPRKANPKVQVSIRYSPEVIAYFKATGRGWQTRMDEALRDWIAEHGDHPVSNG